MLYAQRSVTIGSGVHSFAGDIGVAASAPPSAARQKSCQDFRRRFAVGFAEAPRACFPGASPQNPQSRSR
ncbi:MAG: hypothetical protein ACREJ3_11650, partial [Polyangiaceae bacterium]